jgi:hypothetical protein
MPIIIDNGLITFVEVWPIHFDIHFNRTTKSMKQSALSSYMAVLGVLDCKQGKP